MRKTLTTIGFIALCGGLILFGLRMSELPDNPDRGRRCSDGKAQAAVCDQAAGRILDMLQHDWSGFAARTTGASCLHTESNKTTRPCDAAPEQPGYTNSFVYAMRACGPDGHSDPRITDPTFVMPASGGFSFTYHGFHRNQATVEAGTLDDGTRGWWLRVAYENILNRCTIWPAGTEVPRGNPYFDTDGNLLIPGDRIDREMWVMEVPRRRKPAVAKQFWAANPGEPARPLLTRHEALVSPTAPVESFSALFPKRS